MPRLFLSVIGAAYILLTLWCVALPGQTSQAVGFTLSPGAGQSEYLTVYGGLQLSLGLVFLWPVVRRSEVSFALQTCVLVHACLVLFRSLGFAAFSGFSTTTYALAAVEWLIFLAALFVWRRERSRASST